MERTVIGNLIFSVSGRKAVFFMVYGCLGTGNVDKNGKIVYFPGKRSHKKFRDRMEMLRIFQVAAVFFGILMEKISRVQAAGRKMAGRQAWYAAAGEVWKYGTGRGRVKRMGNAGADYNDKAVAGAGMHGKRYGHARRGRKTITDKVDVGNNPRDGNNYFVAGWRLL